MKKKVSVIMSVYKEPKEQLEMSINSILNQSYNNIEFIIIVDNPEEIWRIDYIKSINDKRIKLIINEKNIGLPKSLNKAIEIATGEYIARMDADDISLPKRIEHQIEYLEKNKLDLCGGNVICFEDSHDLKEVKFPSGIENFKKMIYFKNSIAHPTYFGKSEVFKKLNGYRNFHSVEDYDFILRATNKNYKIGNIPEVVLKYRMTLNSISRSNAGKQALLSKYLCNHYKKEIADLSEENFISYLSSKDYQRKLKKFDNYWNTRNSRTKNRNNPIKYILETIKLLRYFDLLSYDIKLKILEKKLIR